MENSNSFTPKTKTLEESILVAMDGTDTAILPFLPYIFQDVAELGSDPEVIVALLRKHVKDFSRFKVLDLGCGKGTVSIRIANEFNCECVGVDGMREFLEEANGKALACGLQRICRFETGDIRDRIFNFKNFNAVILGAVGPVFGDYYKTLKTCGECIADDGLIVIDDGYIQDHLAFSLPHALKRQVLLEHISDAGMKLVDEVIADKDQISQRDDDIFKNLNMRCQELIQRHPDKKHIFHEYIKRQQEENEALEGELTCATMIVKKAWK